MPSTPARSDSPPLNLWLCLGLPLAIMALLLIVEPTGLDFAIANLAYEPGAGFIGRHSAFLEDVLHDRAKQAVIAFAVLSILALLASLFLERLKPMRRQLGYVVLAMALSTSFVTPMKAVTAVQCPWSLSQFGGKETYSSLLSPRPPTDKPGCCWPGGHAAAGFTLFVLFFVWRDRRPRLARAGLVFALTLGSVFSIGRMLQGAHFFSHNLWTALFCWLICLGSYYAVLYRPARQEHAVQALSEPSQPA
ncbi:phosphatase PAP2 family protein [Pseudomonas cavernicola]|uniref:Phosphatase PAP2 family protein n=1 Tax=Pseudomonas cavernicola TaxID=2320866 RepID=A0A418XH78_9PSED|nr:phosphatase PAP2 family protein [Pseudomonas cavernicola]RJG11823.1 phosphatase PAP2 family protein [Pseudomonas cavernicola]